MVSGFDRFEIPSGEFVPEEFVDFHQGFGDPVFGEISFDLSECPIQHCVEPLGCDPVVVALFEFLVDLPTVDQPVGIPNLVTEIPSLLAQRFIEQQVVPGSRAEQHGQPYAVGSVAIDQVERIGRVAERLTHLPSQFVPNDTGQVDIPERFFSFEFISGHNHTGNPEEEDVGGRNQIVGRVVVFDLFVVGAVDAVEDRDGPQPRREPRVEDVGILPQIGDCERIVAALLTGELQRLFGSFGYDIPAFGQVVGRNLLSPPELTRDTPVLDVLHPVAVGVFEFCRDESDIILHDRLKRRAGKLLHLQEPLHREFGLDYGIGSFRIAHFVGVGFGLFEQACRIEVFLDLIPYVETVHAGILLSVFVQRTVVIEDVDRLESVFFTQHVVVDVVGGSNFQNTGTEFDVDVFVADHRNRATDQRNQNASIRSQMLVSRVIGVDADGRITEDGLGTGRGYGEVFVRALDPIAQVVEFTLRFAVDDLFVRESCLCGRIPVDHTDSAIDFSFVVEVDENFDDAAAQFGIHCEFGPFPVARCAQSAELFEDDAAVFLFPLPSVFEELFTGEAVFVDALGLEFLNDFRLGSDRGVVGTRHPAGIFSLHAGAADQYVLNGLVEHVSHVQHTRHVRGRNNDRIGFALVRSRVKIVVFQPIFVPFGFNLLWDVFRSDFHTLCFLYFRVQKYIISRKCIIFWGPNRCVAHFSQ